MRLFLIPLIVVLLTACGTGSSSSSQYGQYGNFTQESLPTNDQKLADDVVKKLVSLYPPASTRFNLQHATNDSFGRVLIETLRAKGYGVLEFSQAASETSPAIPVAGLSLAYLLDNPKDTELLRIKLQVNQQSLGRAYQVKDGMLLAVGSWVRKE